MTPYAPQPAERRSSAPGPSAALRLHSALALALALAPAATAQNRNLILLDPAHGGQDNGASLPGQPEKDLTLALSATLKNLLAARGFTVATTRDADLPSAAPLLTTDQRAGIANHLRPVACIVLHAAPTGTGVHLTTSALPPPAFDAETSTQVPWETAQTPYLATSQRLANDLGFALLRAKIPVLLNRATLRPLDNLTCPAVAIEVAPLGNQGAGDPAYAQRIADTLAAALLTWRDLTQPRPAPRPATQPAAPAPAGATAP